jgi:hypothetical protein
MALTPILNSQGRHTLYNLSGPITSSNFEVEIAKGNIEGVELIGKFGRNPLIQIADPAVDCWFRGGIYTGFPDVAEPLEVLSTNANDTAGGTGAQEVTITNLLDANYVQQPPVTVQLNGTTPVSLGPQPYLRCSRAFVINAGSTGGNIGQIIVRSTPTPANVFAAIGPAYNQTTMAAFTVPADKTLYLTTIIITMSRTNGSNGAAEVSFRIREFGNTAFRSILYTDVTNQSPFTYNQVLSFPSMTDIKVTIDNVSDNATRVSAHFYGQLCNT